MNADQFLAEVETTLDLLVSAGSRYDGILPSMLDRRTGEMLLEIPPVLVGRREHDRAHFGSNLLLDEATLQTLYGVAESEGVPRYAEAADRYLERFATHCVDTPTGLFPWGEHAYWHLAEDRLGNSKDYGDRWDGPAQHDHFQLTPGWLWERLVAFNPDSLRQFAEGLEFHWNDPDHSGYNRHAYIETVDERYGGMHDHAGDFPSAGGYYIFDWAYAFAQWGEERHRAQLLDMLDYWWERRSEHELLPLSSGEGDVRPCPGMTIALANCLFEAASVLEASDADDRLVTLLRTRARTYIDGILSVPVDPDAGIYFFHCDASDIEAGTFSPTTDLVHGHRKLAYPVWGSMYGGTTRTIAECGLYYCAAYRHTGDNRLLDRAKGAAEMYLTVPFPPEGIVTTKNHPSDIGPHPGLIRDEVSVIPIVAEDPGNAIALLSELFTLTNERRWLEGGFDLAEDVVPLYFDEALPRGAPTVDHYESKLLVGRLIHGLTRLALLERDGQDCALGPAVIPPLS